MESFSFAKKSLGQHFLTSQGAVHAMVEAGHVQGGDVVLEIGPGRGVLTSALLKAGAHVVAVEKDEQLVPVLAERFADEIAAGQLTMVEGDALACQLPIPHTTSYKLVANIPYYITGALLERFLTAQHQPAVLVFLVQKEIAERVARSKKESILSLSVKAYGVPRYVRTVPRGAFSPAPTVDSAILAIEHISRGCFENGAHEERFFALVKAGFAHKRKLLVRNLETILGKRAAEALEKAEIPPKARAEDVPLPKWLILSAPALQS